MSNHERIEHSNVRYEKTDWRLPVVLGVLALIVALIGIGNLVTWLTITGFTPAGSRVSTFPSIEARAATPPPEPRLQINPSVDLAEMRARESAWLSSYGPMEPGYIHIPIEQAMDRLLARGLPERRGKRP